MGMRSIIQQRPEWTICGEAVNGRDALVKTRSLKPDLVILDHALPQMNGVEVTRQLRRTLDVPILFVTMHDAEEVVQRAFDAGINGYLLKSDAGRMLIDAVDAILSGATFMSDAVRKRTGTVGEQRGPASVRGAQLLTMREREVMQLLAEGKSNKEVASALGISAKTAETHRAHVFAKLELHSIAQLVRYAIRNHVIDP